MMMTTACTGSTPKASDKAKAVKGMMPNWQRKPMTMPQGFLMWPNSLLASTVQPMENMTIASMMVSTVLNTRLSIALKSLGGARQFAPEQTVATESQVVGTTVVALKMDIVESVISEVSSELVILRFHEATPVSPSPISRKTMMTEQSCSLLFMPTLLQPNAIGRDNQVKEK